MVSLTKNLVCCSLLWLGPVAAAAAEDPALSTLLEEALAESPALKATEEAIARAQARPAQVRALPDPMLSFGYRNDGWSPSLGSEIMTQLRFGWSQDLPYPGKRRLREDVAFRQVDSATQMHERARLDLIASVKRAYFSLVESRQLLDLLREENDLWTQIEGVARARYSVGEGVQQDVLRVQIELTRIEERRSELEAAAAVASAELNSLAGRPIASPIESAGRLELEPLEGSLEEVLDELRAKSPELANARIAIEEAKLGIELAERERKPDFRVSAGYMNRGQLPPMWEAEIGFNLPVYRDRIESAVAETQALEREASRRQEAIELALRFRSEERFQRMRSRERIAGIYERGVIPQDRLSVEAALASYRVGNVPFVTVLEALSLLYSDLALHARTLADHAELRAALESASLEPMSITGEMP